MNYLEFKRVKHSNILIQKIAANRPLMHVMVVTLDDVMGAYSFYAWTQGFWNMIDLTLKWILSFVLIGP